MGKNFLCKCIVSLSCILSIGHVLYAQKSIPSSSMDIMIEISSSLPDTFKMNLYEHWFPKSYSGKVKTFKKLKNGQSRLELKGIKQPVYFSLFRYYGENEVSKDILDFYFVEPGDKVKIVIEIDTTKKRWPLSMDTAYLVSFSGKGSAKYQCRQGIDNKISSITWDRPAVNEDIYKITNANADKKKALMKQVLNKYKNRMTSIAYELMSTDYFSSIEMQRLSTQHLFRRRLSDDTTETDRIAMAYRKKIRREEASLENRAKRISIKYPEFVLDKLSIGKYKFGTKSQLKDHFVKPQYQYIKEHYFGELRDKILVYFATKLADSKFFQVIVDDALKIVNTNYCLERMNQLVDNNYIGRPAYDFTLRSSSGKLVSLSNFKGKVVFVDFWFYNCSGCVSYFEEVVSIAERHFSGNEEVVFVSINSDTDTSRWTKGLISERYTSERAVNLNTNGGDARQVLQYYNVHSYPKPLLIDRFGNVYSNDIEQLRNGGPNTLIELINKALSAETTSRK